jgi:hypothetical protein
MIHYLATILIENHGQRSQVPAHTRMNPKTECADKRPHVLVAPACGAHTQQPPQHCCVSPAGRAAPSPSRWLDCRRQPPRRPLTALIAVATAAWASRSPALVLTPTTLETLPLPELAAAAMAQVTPVVASPAAVPEAVLADCLALPEVLRPAVTDVWQLLQLAPRALGCSPADLLSAPLTRLLSSEEHPLLTADRPLLHA